MAENLSDAELQQYLEESSYGPPAKYRRLNAGGGVPGLSVSYLDFPGVRAINEQDKVNDPALVLYDDGDIVFRGSASELHYQHDQFGTYPLNDTKTKFAFLARKFVRNLGKTVYVKVGEIDIERALDPQGPEGPKGDRGPEGPEGPEGPKGDRGPEGPEGPRGPRGPEGPEGPIGPEGPPGEVVGAPVPAPGVPGAPGAPAPPGAPGAPSDGNNGDDGDDGERGPRGPGGDDEDDDKEDKPEQPEDTAMEGDITCRIQDLNEDEILPPQYRAPIVGGFFNNGEQTRTFTDPQGEPLTNVFARMINYIEQPRLYEAKAFTDPTRFYYTVLSVKETVYVASAVVEADNDGALDVLCYQNKTGNVQKRRVFVRPGYNVIPLNFLMPRVTYAEIEADPEREVLTGLDRIANENIYSQYTLSYREVHPDTNCVRLTFVDYAKLAGVNKLMNNRPDTYNGVDTREMEFRFGYSTPKADVPESFPGGDFEEFRNLYCFFDITYYCAKKSWGDYYVPEHPIRYQITTEGCQGDPETGFDEQEVAKSIMQAGLSYDPTVDVTDDDGFNYQLTEDDTQKLCRGCEMMVGVLARHPSDPEQDTSPKTSVVVRSASVVPGEEQGGVMDVFVMLAGNQRTAWKRKGLTAGKLNHVRLDLVLDPTEDGPDNYAIREQKSVTYGDGTSEVVRYTQYRYLLWFVHKGANIKVANPSWRTAYENSKDLSFKAGQRTVAQKIQDAAQFPDDGTLFKLLDQAVSTDTQGNLLAGNYGEQDDWGPFFSLTVQFLDTSVTSSRVDDFCYPHPDYRKNCLHFTAEPSGSNVTDVRKLKPLITLAPEFRVGIDEQFPEEKLHVGGTVEAEDVGAKLMQAIRDNLDLNISQDPEDPADPGKRQLITRFSAERLATQLVNRALELVTETLNREQKRARQEMRDRVDSEASTYTNRALELVTEMLNRQFAYQDVLPFHRGTREVADGDILKHIRFAMELMSETLRETVYTKKDVDEFYRRTIADLNFAMRLMGDTLSETVYTRDEIYGKDQLYTKNQLYTKSQLYTDDEVDALLTNYYTRNAVDNLLADYYTRVEVDGLLTNYYTRTAVDDLLADYYTKSQLYTSTEVDNLLSDYYKKDDVYTKTVADATFVNVVDLTDSVDARFPNMLRCRCRATVFNDGTNLFLSDSFNIETGTSAKNGVFVIQRTSKGEITVYLPDDASGNAANEFNYQANVNAYDTNTFIERVNYDFKRLYLTFKENAVDYADASFHLFINSFY